MRQKRGTGQVIKEGTEEASPAFQREVAESLALPMMLPGRTITGVAEGGPFRWDAGAGYGPCQARVVKITLDNGCVLVGAIVAVEQDGQPPVYVQPMATLGKTVAQLPEGSA